MKDTLSFHTALITGGGGGIGLALANWLRTVHRKKIIIAGRTESKLREASDQLGGPDETPYYVLDTGDIAAIPSFIEKVTKEHPELDCLVNNAGVQRPLTVEGMEGGLEEFLKKADQEVDINVRGPMHLALGLLPHFKGKEDGGVVVNVSSVLGFVPFSVQNPCYNGTKAWVHFFTMNLRSQLSQASDGGLKKIKVVEIVPPTVATDLHRDREDPDDNKKSKNDKALSVEEFVEQVGGMWEKGEEVLSAGMATEVVKGWYEKFGGMYGEMTGGGK